MVTCRSLLLAIVLLSVIMASTIVPVGASQHRTVSSIEGPYLQTDGSAPGGSGVQSNSTNNLSFIDNLLSVAPLLGPIAGALVGVIVWLHRRVNQLEEAILLLKSTTYGNEKDPRQPGIASEMNDVMEMVNGQGDRIKELHEKLELQKEERNDD